MHYACYTDTGLSMEFFARDRRFNMEEKEFNGGVNEEIVSGKVTNI